jgi:hypothetical protein
VPAARLQKFTLSDPLNGLLRVIFHRKTGQKEHLKPSCCVKYLRTMQIVCRTLPPAPVLYAITKGSNAGVNIA